MNKQDATLDDVFDAAEEVQVLAMHQMAINDLIGDVVHNMCHPDTDIGNTHAYLGTLKKCSSMLLEELDGRIGYVVENLNRIKNNDNVEPSARSIPTARSVTQDHLEPARA